MERVNKKDWSLISQNQKMDDGQKKKESKNGGQRKMKPNMKMLRPVVSVDHSLCSLLIIGPI